MFKCSCKYPFLEHCVPLFCKTSCSHLFLKGCYIYFERALTAIHCVLTMHLTDSSISDVLLLLFVKGSLYLFYNCNQLSNQVNCDCFKSTEEVLCLLKETHCNSAFSMVPAQCTKAFVAINSFTNEIKKFKFSVNIIHNFLTLAT